MIQRRRRRGGAAIEFGLWLPVIMSMLAGIVDIGWMMHAHHNVVRAARDGARVGVAVIEGDDVVAGTEAKDVAEDHARAILDGVRMTCTDANCNVAADVIREDGVNYLRVTVGYDFEPLVKFLPLETRLQSQFVMMLQQQDEI